MFKLKKSLQIEQQPCIKQFVLGQRLKMTTQYYPLALGYKDYVKPVLLYASETWRTTKKTIRKGQTLINNCLRPILRIHGNRDKAMGLDWPHAPETGIQHYKIGPNMEPTVQEEKRMAYEFLEASPHSRHRGSWVQLGKDREDSPELETLEICFQQLMPWWGSKAYQ